MGLYLSLKTYIVVFQNPDKYENVRIYSSERGFDTILGSQLHQFESKIHDIFL